MSATLQVIVPKGVPLDLRSALLRALDEEARLAKRGLEMPTKTWAEDVHFTNLLKMGLSAWAREVTTTNKIYGYNDAGTKPHIISARNARTLHFFKTGFVSKTRVGKLRAIRGRRATLFERFPLDVAHPGTKARGFSKIVAKHGDERFKKRVEMEINSELRKWGR